MIKSLSDLRSHFSSVSLIGSAAQVLMAPPFRGAPKTSDYQDAAVMILLFEQEGELCFPIIKRVRDGKAHSGQIALPGGKREPGESLWQASIRETNEEIGADKIALEQLLELSPLEVPISGYRIHPYIAAYSGSRDWTLASNEVSAIYTVTLDALLTESLVGEMETSDEGMPLGTPYFLFENQKVWGATAMVLSEFKQLLIGRV